MSYTVATIVEQAYIRITGGQENPDSNVYRADIEAFLPAAINFVLLNDIRFGLAKDARQKAKTPANKTLPLDIAATYEVLILEDAKREIDYFVLPKRVISLPDLDGIVEICTIKDGGARIARFKTKSETRGLEMALQGQPYCWMESIGAEQRIYLKHLDKTVKELLIRMFISADDLGPDDTLPVPEDVEIQILDTLVTFFMEQRKTPGDMMNNNKDDKNPNQ